MHTAAKQQVEGNVIHEAIVEVLFQFPHDVRNITVTTIWFGLWHGYIHVYMQVITCTHVLGEWKYIKVYFSAL